MNTILDHLTLTCTAHETIETPLGPMLLGRSANGLTGAWFAGQKHHPELPVATRSTDDALLARARDQLYRYFAGAPDPFDMPLELGGSPFQQAVWRHLLAIPHGMTRTYRDIAIASGAGAAVRAIGGAIGRNPLSVFVPCHRIVGSDGSLTGYAGGVTRKQALLALEVRAGRGVAAGAAEPNQING